MNEEDGILRPTEWQALIEAEKRKNEQATYYSVIETLREILRSTQSLKGSLEETTQLNPNLNRKRLIEQMAIVASVVELLDTYKKTLVKRLPMK